MCNINTIKIKIKINAGYKIRSQSQSKNKPRLAYRFMFVNILENGCFLVLHAFRCSVFFLYYMKFRVFYSEPRGRCKQG